MGAGAGRGGDPLRELLLFRHAKSRHDEPGVEDHDRDLAPRGIRAARAMGAWLRSEGILPDRVLCSTAVRARRTLALAFAELAELPEIRYLRSLYLASPGRMLDILRRQERDVHRLMLVGHNPGLHGLALRLVAEADPERGRLEAKFPTAALARIGLPIEDWREIAIHAGRLLDYRTPAMLAREPPPP